MSQAIPARPTQMNYIQPDGTLISLTLVGDEYSHFHLTDDGIPVFEIPEGGYVYAYIENGMLQLSGILAHEMKDRDETENQYAGFKDEVLEYMKKHSELHRTNDNEIRRNRRIKRASLGQYNDYIGDFKGLVLLVEFPDLSMSNEYASLNFRRMFNGSGYSDDGALGSVSDYFNDQSYGKFNLTFDIVGPLMMEKGYGYYGANDIKLGIDKHISDLVQEACTQADAYVDYNDYDWDGDGEVDQVFIVFAGYGEHAGAPSNTIWPHESSVASLGMEFDGVKIATYACASELAGNKGQVMSGIGTACHEFSHCLGFPDLYDTDYSGAFGMGRWDLMDSGSYNGPATNGEVPYGFSAYERWVAGWLEPVEITDPAKALTLRDLERYPEAYIIRNDGHEDEYYILENHQNTKWFSYTGDQQGIHGLMVSHVNYDAKAWASNRVNPTPKIQRLSIIPADNEYSYTPESYRNDLFPGPLNVTMLDDFSHKETGGFMYNTNLDGEKTLNKWIVDIEESERGIISFGVFFKDQFLPPEVNPAMDLAFDGYTLSWEPVPFAEYYEVEQVSIDRNHPYGILRKQVSEPINETETRMNWLIDAEAFTLYRVAAYGHGVSSGWSEYMAVNETGGVGGISAEEETIGIYGPDGLKREGMQKGLNIVVTTKETRKVFVK